MIITIKKNSITTFLLFLGCIISVAMIFCFFGHAIERFDDVISGIIRYSDCTMFDFVFGNDYIYTSPGIITLFAFQIAIMIVAIVYIVYIFVGAPKKRIANVLSFTILILIVVAITLAFLTKVLIKDVYISVIMKELSCDREVASAMLAERYPGTRISVGAVSYIVLGFVSFACILIGSILNNTSERRIDKEK